MRRSLAILAFSSSALIGSIGTRAQTDGGHWLFTFLTS